MRIDQVLVSASPGDAVTDFALTLRSAFAAEVRSDLYAFYFDQQLQGQVRPLGRYPSRLGARPKQDLLIVHVTIGEPAVASFVLERPERIAIIYHNISPSDPFRPYDPGFADLLDEGRAELTRFRQRASAAFAASHFNAQELHALGYSDVRPIPLVVDVNRLRSTVPDAAMSERLQSQVQGPVILFVGQMLPHKRPDFLIAAFHVLSTYLMPDANLILVGPERLPAYSAALQTQIDELHLDRAWLTGSVSPAALAAFFRRANLFATASEHEGFCVPLLEAMSFDLPLLARRFGAIPETAGPAGMILDPDDGPAMAAETMARLIDDNSLMKELIGRGRRRLLDFDMDRSKLAWRDALMALA